MIGVEGMTPEERAERVCEQHTQTYTRWGDLPRLIADAIRAAITEEREACAVALCRWCRAKAPYDPTGKLPSHHVVDLAGTKCFAACEARPIRARGGS